MRLVVAANILLAAFLKNAVTREFLLDTRLNLAAPEHLLSETIRHLQKDTSIKKRIGLSSAEIKALFLLLTQQIQVFPETTYLPFMKQALTIAPHREDAPYLALGLMLKAPIWSNDKGLKEQSSVTVYSTQELLVILQGISG